MKIKEFAVGIAAWIAFKILSYRVDRSEYEDGRK